MKLLLVTSRYPWPSRRGDQVRAVQFTDLLAGHHELTLLVPEPGPEAPPPPAGIRIETYRRSSLPALASVLRALVGSSSLQGALFFQKDLQRKLRQLAKASDLVILQLARLAAHAPDVGSTPFVVDLIDALSLNFRRRGELDRALLRPLSRWEAKRLEEAEAQLLEKARGGWVVCHRDRRALERALPGEVLSRLEVLPLAMPLALTESETRASAPVPVPAPKDSRPRLVMTGNLGYFPAVEGFSWWLDSVWPRLRSQRPDLEVVVAGARPARRLRRSVRKAGGLLIESPPDLKGELAKATLALAPLRCGSGQPIKILEAWECGIPVIASSWAAAGTPATPGEQLLVADTEEEWEAQILALLESSEKRQQLVEEGFRSLEEHYSQATVGNHLLRSLTRFVASPAS